MTLPKLPLAFLLSLGALSAANSGATTFLLGRLNPATSTVSPVIYFAVALALCLIAFRPLPRHTAFVFGCFFVILGMFALSSLQADSLVYRDDKVLRTVVAPPVVFFAGYFVGRRAGIDWFIAAAGVFSVAVAVAVLSGGADIASALAGLLGSEAEVLDYQRFGIVSGFGAAVLIPVLNRRTPIWWTVTITLILCAFGSGGRTGVLLVGVGLLARLSLHLTPRILIPGTIVALVAGFFMLNPMLEIAIGVAEAAGAPETVQRALYAALAPPEVTRVWNRPEFLRAAFEAWLSSPVFGVGWGGYPTAVGLPDAPGYYPHNLVAELLAETGLVGTVLTGAWLTAVLGRIALIRSEGRGRHYLASIWATILCGLTISMFVGDFASQWALFLGLGLGLGLSDVEERYQSCVAIASQKSAFA